ncbi:hypothetical protein A7X67_11840 [Clostridium sp. W14A]|nr:hypothetical protein A7X67_11840 [Clostridium sp. W14A]
MMKLFKKKQKSLAEGNILTAVADGNLVSLDNVPDEVFSKRTLGDGVAIQIRSNTIVSPADGVINSIYPHAFGITLSNGIEILVHIGVNTVVLKGKGFETLAEKNTSVKRGDQIIRIDKEFIESSGLNCITMMVVTDPKDYHFTFQTEGIACEGASIVATYKTMTE